MKLYIDPGTGSMLFAILIGIIGAANYIIRKLIIKIRFLLNGGNKEEHNSEKIPYVIFSDDKRYWKNFEPVCREMDRRGIDVVYMTASQDDPVLTNEYQHIHGVFIGSGNKAFAKLNFLNARILLATTPGLDVYQWKRSKEVEYYVHMLHATNDVSLYRMFGTDYYDALLLSGDYQINQVRELEKLRELPAKELVKVGLPYLDVMDARDKNCELDAKTTILLAPTWGPNSIFARFGGRILDELIKTNYKIIVRPHPQSYISEKEMIDKLMQQYPETENLVWNRDNDNFSVQCKSDILISDYSGIIFEFAMVFNKPVIYTSPDFDLSVYDAWWLEEKPWTNGALKKIGEELNENNISGISNVINTCLFNPKYEEMREQLREETWAYRGEGAKRIVDYLENKYNELTSERG